MRCLFLMLMCLGQLVLAQQDSIMTEKEVIAEIESLNKNNLSQYQSVSPKKAGIYSAILPGLGQYHNRKYWKIPIVWGAIGTGLGFIIWNQKQYKRYKTAFDAELNGQPHEFSSITGVDLKTALGNTQDARCRQRDYAIAITAGIYLLNIIDAVVDAHLYEGRKDPDLVISPVLLENYTHQQGVAGLSLRYRF